MKKMGSVEIIFVKRCKSWYVLLRKRDADVVLGAMESYLGLDDVRLGIIVCSYEASKTSRK